MTIAIVGANGFIGSRAVELLHLEARADVRPIVRTPAGLARAARFRVDGRIADAGDRAALTAAFAGCDAVVHAVAGGRDTILGSLTPVYAAAQSAGVRRLVYLSSASVHGQDPPPGTNEESALHERHAIAYNNAKVRAERTLRSLRERGGVELVILRPGIVYGPRASWTAGFADDLLAGRAYLVDGGAGVCNGIYVDNLVHAIRLAIDAGGVDGEAFLVGDEERYTWADLYRPIAAALGYDLAAVPNVAPASGDRDWWGRFNAVRETAAWRTLLPAFPLRLRAAAYASVAAWHDHERRGPSPWEAAPTTRPSPTLEMTLLHRCREKLPFAKAVAGLGYRPRVSFEEACRRSVGWLRFAGYPVRDPEPAAARAATTTR